MSTQYVALIVAVCGLIGGIYGARTARRAAAVGSEANQIKWVELAKAEAESARREATAAKGDAEDARRDADAAKDEAAQARRDLAQYRRDAVEVHDVLDELTRWALRVVNWAQDESINRGELARLINGGPPSLRAKKES